MPLHEPLQHSAFVAQVAPVGKQQRPEVHGTPEQQSAPVAHAAPRLEQPHACVAPLHTTPPQQSVVVLHAPLVTQPHLPNELQVPLQQSAERPQAAPSAEHAQAWVIELHAPPPQHWPSAVQALPVSMQHVPRGQTSPAQQSRSIVHWTPVVPHPHSCVAKLHTPLQQLFPPPPPHDVPSGAHVPQVPLARQMTFVPGQQSE